MLTPVRYEPEVGHSVVAQRKVDSPTEPNRIVGPVVIAGISSCVIHNNPGRIIEGIFLLRYSEWNFRFLHYTKEDSYEDGFCN